MATPEPDHRAFGGQADSGLDATMLVGAKLLPKRLLKGVWTTKDDGPGPAGWRKRKGKIRGQARRKGEKNPMRFGLDFDDSLLNHPKLADWKELPPLKTPQKPKKPKTKPKKKCMVM